MQTFARAAAPAALLLTLALSLSACSEDDDDGDERSSAEASSQTCRLAAAAHASLAGPRASIAQGSFTTGAMAAYDTAMAQLAEAVSDDDEPEDGVTQAVLELVGAYSRTRAFAEENALADSYQSDEITALTAAEDRLYGQLVDVCPVLEGTDDD